MPYRITQCYLQPTEVKFPPLPQPKLVLDLATPEGCKAELTWVGGSVAEWLACWTQAQKGLSSNRSRDAVG